MPLADAACTPANGSARLRLCVSAGEAWPEHVGLAWKDRFGVEILDGVGSTDGGSPRLVLTVADSVHTIEVDEGKIVGSGYSGGAVIGTTFTRPGIRSIFPCSPGTQKLWITSVLRSSTRTRCPVGM